MGPVLYVLINPNCICAIRNRYVEHPDSYQSKVFRRYIKAHVNNSTIVPTFTQFVHFLLEKSSKGSGFDTHWRPISIHCHPCYVTYDAIVKVRSSQFAPKEL